MDTHITDGSTNAIDVIIRRTVDGLRFQVKTDERVERFMASLGRDAEVTDVALYGRNWLPMEEGGSLPIYPLYLDRSTKGYLFTANQKASYRLDNPGSLPLDQDRDRGTMAVSLACLRLVGTSKGEGVSYKVRGVFSTQQVDQIRELLSEACRDFYLNFMKPVGVRIIVQVKEI